MQRIAFYGKGGIGKSTIATSASVVMAQRGMRVLHVGCDPKHDSSLVLVEDPNQFKTVIDQVFAGIEDLDREDLIMSGIHGIDCVESGGPEAGRGCGGRAVSRSFEVFEDVALVDGDSYDSVVYDVLGDVVCGGFAAPMRRSAGSKVVIVLSEELMAAYAANRIAAAVTQFRDNGISLAGLVVNLRNNRADLEPIRRFADAINAPVLGVLPRDPLVCEAEIYRKCIVDYAPESPVAQGIASIVDKVLSMEHSDCTVPAPLNDIHVRRIMRGYSIEEVSDEAPPPATRVSSITSWSQI
jgi:nitrogenase iron protein NifH